LPETVAVQVNVLELPVGNDIGVCTAGLNGPNTTVGTVGGTAGVSVEGWTLFSVPPVVFVTVIVKVAVSPE
jgi:hypothetical protein